MTGEGEMQALDGCRTNVQAEEFRLMHPTKSRDSKGKIGNASSDDRRKWSSRTFTPANARPRRAGLGFHGTTIVAPWTAGRNSKMAERASRSFHNDT